MSPDGPKALKIYDAKFSVGEQGKIEKKRIDQQLDLKGHDCPFLVQIYEGGRFENRLFLLMGRAPGTELEKRLDVVPRNKIRQIVDQVARAAIFLRDRGLCHRDIKAANVFISDTFEHCTLLDISVIRNVSDPIGLGTDHDGQLPIVATARYSPPEYLFRLLEPGADLWHALNVYQLGALLHDLIMREPLFQEEYKKSTQNRYRFAWIIATTNPTVTADDVDRDLILTAQRSLDKDWQRRSTLTLEEFLSDANVQQHHALQVLGLEIGRGTTSGESDLTTHLQRVLEVARVLDESIVLYFREKGVTVRHETHPGPNDVSRLLSFKWTTPVVGDNSARPSVELKVTLLLEKRLSGSHFALSLELHTQLNAKEMVAQLALPELLDQPGIDASLTHQAISGFEQLALKINQLPAR
jgi:serine/threonine protein kinase